jgi:hypothetical protein
LFLKLRYENLYKECLDRNFNVINKIDSFEGIPIKLFNNYLPTEEDRSLLIERITNKGFFLL